MQIRGLHFERHVGTRGKARGVTVGGCCAGAGACGLDVVLHLGSTDTMAATSEPLRGLSMAQCLFLLVRFLLVHRDSWSGRCFSRLTGQTEGHQCSSPSRWLLIPQKRTVGLVVKAADWLLAVCVTLGEV